MPEPRAPLSAVWVVSLGILLQAGPGCAGTHSQIKIESVEFAATMSPTITTAVYSSADSNSADVYLADLPPEMLADPDSDLAGATGNIIHIHLFIYPEAGRVPVGKTACNATVQHVILAGGQAGVYGGGGFIYPDEPPGDSTFSGAIKELTLQPLRQSAAFVDRLGACKFTGRYGATLDDNASRAIASRFESMIAATPLLPSVAGRGQNSPALPGKSP